MAALSTIALATMAAASAYGVVEQKKAGEEAEDDQKKAELKRRKSLSDELKTKATDPTRSTTSGYGGTLGVSASLGG